MPGSEFVQYPTLDRPQTLSDRVAESILDMITSSALRPGDRLPSERDLGGRFGVSRTVVREAMRSLAAKGVLQVHTGSGAVVGRVGFERATEALRLFLQTSQGSGDERAVDYEQIDDVREMIEVRVARRAAATATDDDLRALAAVHEEFVRSGNDPEALSRLDVAFHRLIAESTHNDLYLVMLDSIQPILLEIRRQTLGVPGRPPRAVAAHSEILDRIVAHDADGAEAAMIAHLKDSRSVWQRGTSLDLPAKKRSARGPQGK